VYQQTTLCLATHRNPNCGQENAMLIESRTVVGAAAAFAIVGAVLWGSTLMMSPPSNDGQADARQDEQSWTVEVKDLSFEQPSPDVTQTTAAVTR
jgi:hypothetical protein